MAYATIERGRSGTAAAVVASTKEVQYNITCIQLEVYKKLLLQIKYQDIIGYLQLVYYFSTIFFFMTRLRRLNDLQIEG